MKHIIHAVGYDGPFPEFASMEQAMKALREMREEDLKAAKRCWRTNAAHVTAHFTNAERTAYEVRLGINLWSCRSIRRA